MKWEEDKGCYSKGRSDCRRLYVKNSRCSRSRKEKVRAGFEAREGVAEVMAALAAIASAKAKIAKAGVASQLKLSAAHSGGSTRVGSELGDKFIISDVN